METGVAKTLQLKPHAVRESIAQDATGNRGKDESHTPEGASRYAGTNDKLAFRRESQVSRAEHIFRNPFVILDEWYNKVFCRELLF